MIYVHREHIRMLTPWPECCQYIQQHDPHPHLSFQQLPGSQHSHLNQPQQNKKQFEKKK